MSLMVVPKDHISVGVPHPQTEIDYGLLNIWTLITCPLSPGLGDLSDSQDKIRHNHEAQPLETGRVHCHS